MGSRQKMGRISRVIGMTMAGLLAIAASGCGSDADGTAVGTQEEEGTEEEEGGTEVSEDPASGTEGENEGSTDSGAESEELQQVSVAITGLNPFLLWMISARDHGLMEPAGIDMELVTFTDQAQVMPALLSGSVDVASVTTEQALAAHMQEPSLKMIVGTNTGSPYAVVATPEIETVEDLQGKLIGVNAEGASADYFGATIFLESNGIEDYDFVNVGLERLPALNSGEIDAVLILPPDTVKAEEGGNHIIGLASDVPALETPLIAGLVAQQDWYESNREVAVKFVQGYQDTMEWLYDPANRDAAIADFAAEFEIDTSDAEAVYEYFILGVQATEDPTGRVSLEGLEQTLSNAQTVGLESVSDITPEDLSGFYDNSLVEEALEKAQ